MLAYHSRRMHALIVLALALIAAVAIYGLAASNTVPDSGAGDGTGTISGYTISNVAYTLNATTPSDIDKVTFTVTPGGSAGAPTVVKAKLVSTSSTYSNCTNTSGTTWECSFTGVTVAAADELRVIATQ